MTKKNSTKRNLPTKTQIPVNRLRHLRTERGWSIPDVAQFVGVDDSLVSMHERSKRRLTEVSVDRYARLYQVSGVELFYEVVDGELVPPAPVEVSNSDKPPAA